MINTFCPKCGEKMEVVTNWAPRPKVLCTCLKCDVRITYEPETVAEIPENRMKTPEKRTK